MVDGQHYSPLGHRHVAYPGIRHVDQGYYQHQPAFDSSPQGHRHELDPQVCLPSPIQDLIERVQNLEERQHETRNHVDALELSHKGIRQDIDTLKKGGWKVAIGPFKQQPQDSNGFQHQVQQPKTDIDVDMDRKIDDQPSTYIFGSNLRNSNQSNGSNRATAPSVQQARAPSLPPHLRGAIKSALTPLSTPPHLRPGAVAFNPSTPSCCQVASANDHVNNTPKDPNNPLVTDGPVDPMPPAAEQLHMPIAPVIPPSPTSPTSTTMAKIPRHTIEDPFIVQSGKGWMPRYICKLPALTSTEIPPVTEMVTFSADFLHNQLGGITWSPGLNYIPPNSTTPSLVKNRSYYTLDAGVEPYLPKGPGEHGAKLTAFFNTNPSDIYEEAEEDSFDETPLFACATPWATEKDQRRYVYFGNYSQTRWSDKLDYDRMIECVPAHVKQYWAEELAAKGRPKWVTEALMKHFWPKPVYDGAITVPADDSDDKMMRDIKFYITELKAWEKEARLKVNLIKKEDILKAFDTADADDPPALRLWWEYLQCAGWDKNFYDMLVTLQARNKNYF